MTAVRSGYTHLDGNPESGRSMSQTANFEHGAAKSIEGSIAVKQRLLRDSALISSIARARLRLEGFYLYAQYFSSRICYLASSYVGLI